MKNKTYGLIVLKDNKRIKILKFSRKIENQIKININQAMLQNSISAIKRKE